MTNWFRKWLAFFRPVEGWKNRFLAFKRGQTGWQVPGRPECHQVAPWPVEWIPHRLIPAGEGETEAEEAQGFRFLDAICVETGVAASVGEAVRCCRCGVDLHPRASNQFSAFDPARCNRCKWIMGFYR